MNFAKNDRPQSVSDFLSLLTDTNSNPVLPSNPVSKVINNDSNDEIDIDTYISSILQKKLTIKNLKVFKRRILKVLTYTTATILYFLVISSIDVRRDIILGDRVDPFGDEYSSAVDSTNNEILLKYGGEIIDRIPCKTMDEYYSPVVEVVDLDVDAVPESVYDYDIELRDDVANYVEVKYNGLYGMYRYGKKILPINYIYIKALGDNSILVSDENYNQTYVDKTGKIRSKDILYYAFEYAELVDIALFILGILIIYSCIFVCFKLCEKKKKDTYTRPITKT